MKQAPGYISKATAKHMEFCWHGVISMKDFTGLLAGIDADFLASNPSATEEQREVAMIECLVIVGYSAIESKHSARTYFHKFIYG